MPRLCSNPMHQQPNKTEAQINNNKKEDCMHTHKRALWGIEHTYNQKKTEDYLFFFSSHNAIHLNETYMDYTIIWYI